MYIKEGWIFLVIKFPTAPSYLNIMVTRRPLHRVGGKWPRPPAAARYYRGKNRIKSSVCFFGYKYADSNIWEYFLNMHLPNIDKGYVQYIPKIPGGIVGNLSQSADSLFRTLIAAKGAQFLASCRLSPRGPYFYPKFGQHSAAIS